MVKGADGKPLADADVSVLFVMPATPAIGEMRNEVKLKSAGAGKYTGTGNVMMAVCQMTADRVEQRSLLHD